MENILSPRRMRNVALDPPGVPVLDLLKGSHADVRSDELNDVYRRSN